MQYNRERMKLIPGFFLAASLLIAQNPAVPVLTVSGVGPQVAYPGAVLNLQVVLSNSVGWNIAGLGLSSWSQATGTAAGSASVTAQKTLWCATAGCLLTGLTNPPAGTTPVVSNSAYADGQVLTLTYGVLPQQSVGSTLTIAIPTPVFAVDTSGNAVSVSVAPLSLPVTLNPACVATANADVQAFLAAPSQMLLGQLEAYLGTIVAGSCK
jgi:hypothetical protein